MARDSIPGGIPAPAARTPTYGVGRLEAFSDGVIAVAITLLVLDLRVPQPEHGVTLAVQLGRMWLNYLAYAISFLAIGIMWMNHHAALRRLRTADHAVLLTNLLQCLLLAWRPRLLRDPLTAAERRSLLLRGAIAPPAYLVAALLGLLSPYLTLAACIVMGLFYLVPLREVRRDAVPGGPAEHG